MRKRLNLTSALREALSCATVAIFDTGAADGCGIKEQLAMMSTNELGILSPVLFFTTVFACN